MSKRIGYLAAFRRELHESGNHSHILLLYPSVWIGNSGRLLGRIVRKVKNMSLSKIDLIFILSLNRPYMRILNGQVMDFFGLKCFVVL